MISSCFRSVEAILLTPWTLYGLDICDYAACSPFSPLSLSVSLRSEATREVPLRGGQHPVWGRREARWRPAEAVWEVWLQGAFPARSEPRCDHQLSLHHPSVPRAGTIQGVPQNCFLHWGTYTLRGFLKRIIVILRLSSCGWFCCLFVFSASCLSEV